MISSKRLIQRSFKVDDETTPDHQRAATRGLRLPAHRSRGADLTPRPCIFCARCPGCIGRGCSALQTEKYSKAGTRELTAVLTILQLRVEAGWRAHSEQPWA